MDKQLKHLKTHYENEIPTTFTEQDKKAVFEKIQQLDTKQKKGKVIPFFPKALTGTVVAVAILLIVVTINSQPGMFHSSHDEASESTSSDDASIAHDSDREMNTMENAEITGEESSDERYDMGIAMDTINLNFDPEAVLIGSSYGNMEVVEVEHQDDDTTIVFHGEMWVSGAMKLEGDQLSFVPHVSSVPDIPLAIGDDPTDMVFQFENEDVVRMEYGITDQQSIMKSDQGYLLEVSRMVYHHSSNGSSVELKINERVMNTYETRIELSDELLNIYKNYKVSLDDTLLEGLNPIDVFKLHFHAKHNEEREVEHALFIQDPLYGTPDKETYLHDPFFVENEVMKQNSEELYQQLLEVEEFQEEYLSDTEALIRFTNNPPETRFFRLIKNEDLDVWKVAWLPMQ